MKTEKTFSQYELNKLKALLAEKTGYRIHGNGLLMQAFTRSSYSAAHGGENNEVLEFIGDQVLAYYLVKCVSARFSGRCHTGEYAFRIRENRLTQIKHELVSNDTLSEIIDDWGIERYLVVGRADYASGAEESIKIRGDLFEAILGAIALESKWDPTVLETAVNKMLDLDHRLSQMFRSELRPPRFNIDNAVNTLKGLAATAEFSPAIYEFTAPEDVGYDEDGRPIWHCRCSVITSNTGISIGVKSSSKKLAKKAAAYLVLCAHFELQNEYGPNSQCTTWIYDDNKLLPDFSESPL